MPFINSSILLSHLNLFSDCAPSGTRIALTASIFNKKHGLTVAHKQVYAIANKLKVLDPNSGNTYLEC